MLSRPPPPADVLTGSTAAAPAHAGPSPAGHSAARMPGHSPAPGENTESVGCGSVNATVVLYTVVTHRI